MYPYPDSHLNTTSSWSINAYPRRNRPHGHGDRLRFCWALGPAGGEALAKGADFAELTADGRLAQVTGFFDLLPQAA